MLVQLVFLASLLGSSLAVEYLRVVCNSSSSDDIYQFDSNLLDGTPMSMANYAGQVLLIYNVATYSYNTDASYTMINSLASTYSSDPFAIAAFPCHQFGLGEPGLGFDEIMNGIFNARPGGGFVPDCDMHEKTNVNGLLGNAIFDWLKTRCSFTDSTYEDELGYSPKEVGDINWNFEKFLIGKDGKAYFRYHPDVTDPADLYSDINDLLAA